MSNHLPAFFAVLSLLFYPAVLSASELLTTERYEHEEVHLGTLVRIILYAHSQEVAEKAVKEAFASFVTVNEMMNTYDSDSELSKLNRSQCAYVSKEIFTVLKAAKHYSTLSDGAFDVTAAPMVRLWRRSSRLRELPSEQLIAQAKELVGNHLWELEEQTQTIRLLKPGMRLDLGGIAKGYAIDRAFEIIQTHGITSLLVDAGGDFRVGLPPPNTEGWRIAKDNKIYFMKETAMATSGGRFQFVEIDGTRYAHIVDPKTGLGITGLHTVYVTAPTAMEADALATAVSVLGKEKGKKLISTLPKVSVEIVE